MNIDEGSNDVLTVKPFDNQLKQSRELHPDLPNPSFAILLVGPPGSGKSNLILRLIYGNKKSPKCNPDNKHYKFYRHHFSKIYVFSRSWSLDKKTSRCRIPENQIFEDEEDYEEILAEIVKGQEEDAEEDELEEILLIFTDLAGTKLFSTNRGVLSRIAFNRRHLGISYVVDSQALRQINSAMRSTMSAVILFAGISNRQELKKISEEYLGRYTPEQARNILKYAFKTPFDFLYVNLVKRQLYRNFNPLTITTA